MKIYSLVTDSERGFTSFEQISLHQVLSMLKTKQNIDTDERKKTAVKRRPGRCVRR